VVDGVPFDPDATPGHATPAVRLARQRRHRDVPCPEHAERTLDRTTMPSGDLLEADIAPVWVRRRFHMAVIGVVSADAGDGPTFHTENLADEIGLPRQASGHVAQLSRHHAADHSFNPVHVEDAHAAQRCPILEHDRDETPFAGNRRGGPVTHRRTRHPHPHGLARRNAGNGAPEREKIVGHSVAGRLEVEKVHLSPAERRRNALRRFAARGRPDALRARRRVCDDRGNRPAEEIST